MPELTEIFFIRHGQTAQNAAKRFQGHSNTELNPTGRDQAERIAQRLAGSAVAAVYSSDLARAEQTATAIAERLDVPVVARPDLREIDVGRATGMSKDELMQSYPALFGANWHEVHFPDGESYDETGKRMAAAARQIAAAHPDQTVVAVSHGGSIRSAIAELIGIPIDTLAGLFVTNTSITRIGIDRKGRARLLGLNDAAHLETWCDSALS